MSEQSTRLIMQALLKLQGVGGRRHVKLDLLVAAVRSVAEVAAAYDRHRRVVLILFVDPSALRMVRPVVVRVLEELEII